jgi:hypothetical protein
MFLELAVVDYPAFTDWVAAGGERRWNLVTAAVPPLVDYYERLVKGDVEKGGQ